MTQSEIQRLDSLMSGINTQLNQLGELLADIAKWPDGPNKQQMLDRIFQNQDALFVHADEIRNALRQLGFDIPHKV